MSWNNLLAPLRLPAGPHAGAAEDELELTPERHPPPGTTTPPQRLGYDATLAEARRAMRRDDWASAEAWLMSAGPLAGDDAAYCNLVGVLWEVRGRPRAARRFYGRAIRADRRYEPSQLNMRRLYELQTFGHTRHPPALGDEPRPFCTKE